MADANQLKIEARREEAAGDYEQASRLYLEALSAMDEGGSLSDPSLLVRVADLEYRQDDPESALEYYLQAVDEYAEQGLITNAIAVCNKILRVFPDHVECHRRLADLHMAVGLTAEARQNLLQFADEAWDPDDPEQVLEAMRSFLDRTPDQEVARELASRLEGIGRPDDALETLKGVWEERTRAGADVETLERKAEEIHSRAVVEDWSRRDSDSEEDAEEPVADADATDAAAPEEPAEEEDQAAAVGAGAESPTGVGEESGRKSWDGAPPDLSDLSEAAGEGVERRSPRAPRAERELELVAAFRDRFTRFRRSAANGGTAGRREDGDEAGWEEPAPSEGTDGGPGAGLPELDPHDRGPDADAPEPPSTQRERTPEREDAPPADAAPEAETTDRTEEEDPAEERRAPAADADSDVQRERDRIMEELNELDRASETSSADADGWDDDLLAGDAEGGAPRAGGEGRAPDRGREASSDDQLGEEAELRRGMELVDDMLEVQPENLDLRERKLRYARRLGDRDALVEASLDLADALAKKDARRSARALYRRVLELDRGNQAAESGLARLDVGELEEKRQAGKRAGTGRETREAASPEEQEARKELGMRLWTEFENSIREMPWLHAATQAYQATGPDALPPIETFEMLAHYLMARERYRDAARILERALELTDAGDQEVTDALYYLGRAHETLGEHDRAAEYFDRLERVDSDFARVRETLREGEADAS